MIGTLDEYKRMLQGFFFTDCVVRSRNIFSFVMSQWLTEQVIEEWEEQDRDIDLRDKRIVHFARKEPHGSQWSGGQYEEWDTIIGGAASLPKEQFIGIQAFGDAYGCVIGSGEDYVDDPIPNWRDGGPDRGTISKIKTIEGYAWYCGGGRSVGKRLGRGQWLAHTLAIPVSADPSETGEGFRDMDAFNAEDIYAVGGHGDVWHYDGQHWRQLAFPSNTFLFSVCCAQDGQVYIAGYQGVVFAGRGDRWRKIHSGGLIALPFVDMVWYEDRVWCTNENGFWTIHDDQLHYVSDLPAEISVCAGNLSVNDGVMLVAGVGGAAFCEKGQWHSIILPHMMEKTLRE